MKLKAGPCFNAARALKAGVINEKDDLVGQKTRTHRQGEGRYEVVTPEDGLEVSEGRTILQVACDVIWHSP